MSATPTAGKVRAPREPRRLRDESGAISIMAAVAMVAIMMSAALAVDIGRLSWVSRDLQGTTDRVALDAVRKLGDLYNPADNPRVAVQQAAEQSLSVNLPRGADGVPVVTTRVGRIDRNAGTFTEWDGGADVPTAVEVTTTSFAPFVFDLSSSEGGRAVARIAYAEVSSVVGLSVGTTLASVQSDAPGTVFTTAEGELRRTADGTYVVDPSLLPDPVGGSYLTGITAEQAALYDLIFSNLFGKSINLGVVGYQGLATADVRLGDLMTELGIVAGSPDTALDVNNTQVDFLTAMHTALVNQASAAEAAAEGDAISAVAALQSALQGGATQAGAPVPVNPALPVNLSTIISSSLDDVRQMADTEVGVFDLLLGSIMQARIADGTHALSITMPVPAALSGQVTGSIKLGLIEAPVIAVGRPRKTVGGEWETVARSAAIRISLDLNVINPVPLAGILPANLRIALTTEVAAAEAALQSVACQNPANNSDVTVGTTSGVVRAGLRPFTVADVTQDIPSAPATPSQSPDLTAAQPLLTLATGFPTNVTVLRLNAAAGLVVGESSRTDNFVGTPVGYGQTISGGDQSLHLGDVLAASNITVASSVAGLLPLSTAAIIAQVNTVLDPIVDQVEAEVLDQVLTLLGVKVGSADTTVHSVDCTRRTLVALN